MLKRSSLPPVTLIAVIAMAYAVSQASAGVIIQPTGLTAEQLGPTGNLIDQSGLTPYTSGVTDFETYVQSALHGDPPGSGALFDPIFPQLFTFDLGGPTPGINGFAVWSPNVFGLRDFELFSDTDGDFGNGGTTSLGSFTATLFTGRNRGTGESFDFSATTTRFVHMRVGSRYGSDDLELGEFAFRQIPEPTSLALLGLGGMFVALRRRRSSP